jgi:small conductance mechanosensitive channel
MRFILNLALLLAIVSGAPAVAQSVAVHQAAAAPATKTTPAKATSVAIIPGSPLAALTGAAPAATTPAPAPFGTEAIGMSITESLGIEATKSFDDFVAAIRRSTRLTPVLNWLRDFHKNPRHFSDLAAIAMALAITILPGLVVEAVVRLGLTRVRARLARRAAPLEIAAREDDESGLADAEAGETEKRPRRRDTLLIWSRRLLFGLLHFGLALLPVVGFVVTTQLIISAGYVTTRPAHLAAVGIVNGYLFCRIAAEIIRFPLTPRAASLRLIPMPDGRAVRIMKWVQILLATGFAGFVIVSIAEILDLSHDGALVVLRLVALVIHIEIAVAIWQSRHVVGHWISGKKDSQGIFGGFRHRMGTIWHYLALFYVLALWIAYAGGVHNAFSVLLRVVLVFIAAIVVGRLTWTGSTLLLERIFPDPSAANARHPALYARARAYNPLLRLVIQIVIAILVVVTILQGWGIDAFGWLFSNAISRSLIGAFIAIIITIAIALTIWECANALIEGRIDNLTAAGKTRQATRLRTVLPILKATIGVSIALVAGLICLSRIGVNAAPLLAGAGVLGIAIGFGSQKLVQDIITGLFLLLEDAMQVGDIINLAGMTGTVERLSIRTIRLRGKDGSINIIPFSAVTTVTNMTRDFGYAQISIQVGYEEDLPRVYAILTDISRTMRKEPAWGAMMRDDLQIFGLDEFGASALVITGQIRTGPGQHWAVRREFYARVKRRFESEHIDMPYTYLAPAPPRLPAPDVPEAAETREEASK